MEWHKAPQDQHYTLRTGDCVAVVLYAVDGTWLALAGRDGISKKHATFQTREDAQAWCVIELVELRAQGQHSAESGPS